MIKLNIEYTYPMICEELNWKQTTGEAKQKQIREIEECFEWYHPENKKTHKPKKSYIFTKQLKEPQLVDHRKSQFPDEEFNYLLDCLLRGGYDRNTYFQRGMNNNVYLTSSLIYKEFGFDIYAKFNTIKWNVTDKEVQQMFKSICLDAVKANTITRICKRFGYEKNSLPKGILRQRGQRGKAGRELVMDDDLLEKYNEYEAEYVKEYKCNSIQDALQQGVYFKILEHIKERFEEEKLYGVKRYNMISFEGEINIRYDYKKKALYQGHLQEVILASIEKSVNNRINDAKDYKYKLNDWQKSLMYNYLCQLLGEEVEEIEEEPAWLDAI